ncbi:hypothetical protein [Haloferax sp. Atlit-48N]|uniref:Uncharacterized protein n=1 Tax=Haloferax sp. Atlit-48N TaxID=2077198 RepID=A0ACD5I147_9EURY|nr:hypothetical protein [Haloferax sp. Atlit-48N]
MSAYRLGDCDTDVVCVPLGGNRWIPLQQRRCGLVVGVVDTVLEVIEVSLETLDVCFEFVHAHERESEELVIALRHERELACGRDWIIGLVGALADEFIACGTQFASEEFSIVHGECTYPGCSPLRAHEGRGRADRVTEYVVS